MAEQIKDPGCIQFCCYYLLIVQPSASHLSSLGLNFSFSKVVFIILNVSSSFNILSLRKTGEIKLKKLF